MSGLDLAVGRLRDQPPVLQPLGVHAVFDLISRASNPPPGVIAACLGVSSPVSLHSSMLGPAYTRCPDAPHGAGAPGHAVSG